MNEIVKVSYDNNNPTVSGRELHEALEVKSKYADWIKNMCAYGFGENQDYTSFSKNLENGGRTIDHQLSIDMAKQICMIQRTEKGKKCREYFIELEKQWNSPDAVIARALQFAHAKLFELQNHAAQLETTVAVQEQQIAELQPKASYYDVVLNCKDLLSVSKIAKDYGWSARKMNDYLHELGIQYKQGDIWLLYQKHAQNGYTSTKSQPYNGSDGEVHTRPHTYWTQKGRLFIYDSLARNGIFPLIERS